MVLARHERWRLLDLRFASGRSLRSFQVSLVVRREPRGRVETTAQQVYRSCRHGGHVVWINVDVTQPLAWKKEPYYSRIKTWSGIARTGNGYVAVIIGKRFYVVFPEEDLEISGFEPGAADISVGYRNTDGWSRPLVKMCNREESVQEFLGLPFRRPYGG